MTTIIFLLEEPSAKVLLEGLLPRILPASVTVKYQTFEGKSDLEKRIVRRIRDWQDPLARFVVMRDQDANPDCRALKLRLQSLADQSQRAGVLVRIACKELESWALGDWPAVARAFERPNLEGLQRKAQYRDPDRISNPCAELKKHVMEYQKVEGARRLGLLLDPDTNRSQSFKAFCDGVRRLAAP